MIILVTALSGWSGSKLATVGYREMHFYLTCKKELMAGHLRVTSKVRLNFEVSDT